MQRRYTLLLTLLVLLLGLASALAWRIHTWGQPSPVVYRRLNGTSVGSRESRFTYLRVPEGDGAARLVYAVDSDGDGTIDRVLTEGHSVSSFARPQADEAGVRWLVVCLDGVPFAELLALWEEGYFREFFRPVPLISSFPSDSENGLTDVFHTDPVPGYEHRYFDREANRIAGGVLTTITGRGIPYLDLLDYDMPGYLKGVTYVLPYRGYRADLGRLRQHFLASQDEVYLAHIASTDSLYHILPRGEMRRLLLEVDSLLRELYLDAAGNLRLTVFSDHGNSLVRSRCVPLEEFLEERGWRLRQRLNEPRDVVVPAYGLVGFLAVYCQPAARAKLARQFAFLEGVDLVIYSDADSVIVETARGGASLQWNRDATSFRYEPLGGDPLFLAHILRRLQREGKMDAQGWVKDADWFEATSEHRYPDPTYRLWQWATNHVRNRADLVLSLEPGYFYGSGVFQHVVDILSTHGALDRAQSVGFAMNTDSPLQGSLRSRDLLPTHLAVGGDETTFSPR